MIAQPAPRPSGLKRVDGNVTTGDHEHSAPNEVLGRRDDGHSSRGSLATSISSVPASNGAPAAERDALVHRARALLAQGLPLESEGAFRQLLASPSHATLGLYGIGVARLTVGDLDSAQSFFERVLERELNHTNSLYQLGVIAQRRGLETEARSYYQRVIELDPEHVGARQRLGMAAAKTSTLTPPTQQRGSALYDYLSRDQSSLARQTVAALDALEMNVRPSFLAYAGSRFARFAVAVALALVAAFALVTVPVEHLLPHNVILPIDLRSIGRAAIGLIGGIAAGSIAIAYARVRSTSVTVRRGRLQIRTGILSRRLVNVEIWRIHNIELERSLLNRITGDGTLLLECDRHTGGARSKRASHRESAKLPLVELTGLARGRRLEDIYQELLNVVFLLRSNPAVKGIIQ